MKRICYHYLSSRYKLIDVLCTSTKVTTYFQLNFESLYDYKLPVNQLG